MQFKQKMGLYKCTFDFGDEKLSHSISVQSTTSGGTVSYDALPTAWKTRRTDAFWWLKYLTAAFIVTGVLFAINGRNVSLLNSAEIFCTFAGFGVALHLFCRLVRKPVLLTIIPLVPPIHILHDEQYQAISNELLKRRSDRLRIKHGTVDLLNQPAQEFWKFRQLRDEGIITENEYGYAMRQLYMMNDKTAAASPAKLN